MFFNIVSSLPILAFVASQASASSSVGQVMALLARQTTFDPNDIPSACQSVCDPVVKIINGQSSCSFSDASCICTNSTITSITGCFGCFIGQGGVASAQIQQESQQVVDSLNQVCAGSGITIPSLSVPAPSGSATAPTGSQTQSQSGGSASGGSSTQTQSGSNPAQSSTSPNSATTLSFMGLGTIFTLLCALMLVQ